MGLDLSAATSVIKEFYDGPVRDQLNHKTVLMHRLERNTQDFEGQECVLPLRISRNEGIGARAERGILPAAGAQGYAQARFNMAYNYASIELTGPAIAAMRSNEGSFIRALDSEINGAVNDMSDDMNRQCFGDATGTLAISGATATSTVQAVGSTKFLRPGMKLDAVTHATGALVGTNVTVSSVNSATQVTLDTSITMTSGATRLVRHGSYGKEIFGLAAIVSDANPEAIGGVANPYGQISRATAANSFWKAQVKSNSGVNRALNLDLMEEAQDSSDELGDGSTSLIITDFQQYRNYASLLIPDKRFPTANGQTIDLDGGFKALTFNQIPLTRDKHAPANKMWFLDESNFAFATLVDFAWIDEDGQILKKLEGVDAFGATLSDYRQLVCDDCANQVLLSDLAA